MNSIITLIYFAILILQIAAFWMIFTKAGHPGWAALIPFYNIYVLLQVAGKPGWWLVLLFIPVVSIVITVLVNLAVADNFGRGVGFAIGLILLPFVFFPILAFGNARYTG